MPPPSLDSVRKRISMDGQADPRGPQGMFSRGANVYNGGTPQAHIGGGNPNIGRPSHPKPQAQGSASGIGPSMSTLVGSLPPTAEPNLPPNLNSPTAGGQDMLMNLLQMMQQRQQGGL